ncbi:AfsR/SARP family transcriptional regulator, partial [Streptomyces sp. IBSBF 2806]|uniref:AfsR/SARP family transcriptional regulator n=1 Tax=Streptomyces sp. IBSBF 2806 TaxID=2903529 RepID=UPI002FDC3A84
MPLEPVRFAVLGDVRVRRGDAVLGPAGPQERAFVALLLVGAGQPIAVSEIVEVLWGADPPRSAVNVVRRHVGSLRRMLEPGLAARAEGRWLVRDAGGYRLVTDGDSSDLLRFRALRQEASRLSRRAPEEALELLTEALTLWQGPVAAGIPERVRAHAVFAAVDRERLAAVREAADAASRAGTPETVLSELRQAAARHPLDEPLQSDLVLALAAAGRRSEALTAYESVRARLAEELGIDPGAELREARDVVLREPSPASAVPQVPQGEQDARGPAVLPDDPAVLPDDPAASPHVLAVPSQLPHDIPAFTGRWAEVDEILGLLDTGGHQGRPGAGASPAGPSHAAPSAGMTHAGACASRPGTVVISAIGGMAGVGKTSLAVHWAHRVADRFPDGRLYVNLRGFDPSGAVMEPGEAVRGFLEALGVPPERVPHGVDAQSALYRSVLAGRKVLVVLDNARDADQVEPLLPASSGCLAIVTSRDELSGLVAAHGAHSLILHPFDAGQARAFLVRRLGDARVAAEPEAADEISRLCAGLPLALACVAARAAVHPHFSLSAVAAELREAHGSLDAFARGDATVDVGTVFSWSSRAVSAEAARLFRLLALHPGPDFTLPAAAALAGLTVRRTRPLLAELTALHLVAEPTPARYAFHDLLRAHARELVHDQHTGGDRRAALDRLYHHYLHTAHAADRLLAPNADPLPP